MERDAFVCEREKIKEWKKGGMREVEISVEG